MSEIDALLQENRKFAPSAEFKRDALVSDPSIYSNAARDPEAFWESEARKLEWSQPWKTVLYSAGFGMLFGLFFFRRRRS